MLIHSLTHFATVPIRLMNNYFVSKYLGWLLTLVVSSFVVFIFSQQSALAQTQTPYCTPSIDAVYTQQSTADAPNLVNADAWQSITLPDIWTMRWPDFTGVVWYRLDWSSHCTEQGTSEPLALLIHSMNMAGKVWLNQDVLWSDPNLTEPLSRSWNSPRFLSLPSVSIKHTSTNQLYFRLTGDALSSPGLGVVSLGDSISIAQAHRISYWNHRTLFYLNIIFSFTLGMICACIWLFRRQEVAYGWYALTSLFWIAFISNTLIVETAPFPNTASLTQFNIAFFIFYSLCFSIFSWRFLGRKLPEIEKVLYGFTIFFLACIWLGPDEHRQSTLLTIFYVAIILFMLNSLFVSYLCFRTRQVESWLLGLTLIVCLILSAISILSLFHFLGNISLVLSYTSLFFALFLSIVLAMRLSKSLYRIERFNEELTQKIMDAEQKLESTLTNRYLLTVKNNQLKERLNLAHELHDGLGSSLVRAMLEVGNAKQALSNKHTLSILSLLRNDLRQIIDSFSESQTKLPSNPIYWLAPLRNRFIQIFDDMGIKLQWEVDAEWIKPPSPLQCLTLYRVAEEALTNVIKHSQATEVSFRCSLDKEHIELQIIDNGIGFNTVDIDRSGIGVGMRSMRARIERLSGILNIQSRPGKTSIISRVPYDIKKA